MPEMNMPAPPAQEKQKKQGLFKQKDQPQKESADADLLSDLADMSRRLRTIEERYANMQGRIQLIEHNMVSHYRYTNTEIKTQTSEITEVKKELHELKDRLLMMIREMEASAKKEDVKVLERYLNMWEPLNFVTRNEVNDIIREILLENQKNS